MPKTHLKLIEIQEAKEFFNLIHRNKERLTRYFPVTVKSNKNITLSTKYLKKLEQKAEKKAFYAFGIYTGNKLIGVIYVKNIDWQIQKCELGYFLDKDFEGKGIMAKNLDKAISYCFNDLNMNKLFLRIGRENTGSKRLAKKKGFELEGTLRKEYRIETGELIDVEYYGKLNDAYQLPA